MIDHQLSEKLFADRRKTLLSRLDGEAALLCGLPVAVEQHDARSVPTQDASFRYLTGILEVGAALLLLGRNGKKAPRSILFLRDRDHSAEIWHGERLGLKRARKRFAVDEVQELSLLKNLLLKELLGFTTLHYVPGVCPETDSTVWKIFSASDGRRPSHPRSLSDLRELLGEMRLVKTPAEIKLIRQAVKITVAGFKELAPQIPLLTSELHGARVLEGVFSRFGCAAPAFPTIFAAGKNATFLHHSPTTRRAAKGDLVLVDAGATFAGYNADITRCFPVSGRFTPAQAEIYDLVHSAVKSALGAARPGATLARIQLAAAATLSEGLRELGILRKTSTRAIFEKGLYRRFFMHRIGHFLGMDVHEYAPPLLRYSGRSSLRRGRVSPETDRTKGKGTTLTGWEVGGTTSWERPLCPGNLFTIEPGLYFDHNDSSIPKQFRGIGIRLEEDLLITPRGHEVLTSALPMAREKIESLMGR